MQTHGSHTLIGKLPIILEELLIIHKVDKEVCLICNIRDLVLHLIEYIPFHFPYRIGIFECAGLQLFDGLGNFIDIVDHRIPRFTTLSDSTTRHSILKLFKHLSLLLL